MSGTGENLMLPKALTDFVFDLYDSVTLSQLPDEQAKLYEADFTSLSSKYFGSTPWPSPQQIAGECNGDPLFLAVYRELTHRHWHAVSRPTLRDRLDGWHVYCNLFDEILDQDSVNFYLVPSWTFDILHEFVYQFQGFCQVRSAVYATARKNGLVDAAGNRIVPADGADLSSSSSSSNAHTNLLDNWTTLEQSKDCWDVQVVFGYLQRLAQAGFPSGNNNNNASPPPAPVYTYFSTFGAVVRSRLECLLGDYTACLQALTPLSTHGSYVIPKDVESTSTEMGVAAAAAASSSRWTIQQTVHSVLSARISVAYHASVSLLMLRRYKDAVVTLAGICTTLKRGFKTGQYRKQPEGGLSAADQQQLNKQYDRMLSLLAILLHICPTAAHSWMEDESLVRLVREKHGSKLQTATSYEPWFQCPKFIAANPNPHVVVVVSAAASDSTDHTATAAVVPPMNFHRQQVTRFLQELAPHATGRTLRSYLKLYTRMSLEKLAKFHDCATTDDFLPLLLSYKLRMRQLERNNISSVVAVVAGGGAVVVGAEGGGGGPYLADSDSSDSSDAATVTVYKTALDIHYYVEGDVVHVDEAERPRRFENYFIAQLTQDDEIRKEAVAIETKV